jgi:hypothetical protein
MIVYSHREALKEKEDETMTEWYMNPEIHADDYEELQDLLQDLAEEDPED